MMPRKLLVSLLVGPVLQGQSAVTPTRPFVETLASEKLGGREAGSADEGDMVKIEGKAQSFGKTLLTSDLCKSAAYGIMNKYQIAKFEEMYESSA